ncbi:hypothetical protein C5167_048489 [Papaver somniferum]|uniref:Uncharacterized protein n=1 Tax=Papaver somniferum TaxID=3469 RepID=A0A4Y7KLP1_PAPSO|nr:hypothetical protein C5167_048489 [Papaver somniferum]
MANQIIVRRYRYSTMSKTVVTGAGDETLRTGVGIYFLLQNLKYVQAS